jgi:3'-phosphoadenosine 5'-phosphosulfate sulfotransferase (PAPS reductase)/FAD synthetase
LSIYSEAQAIAASGAKVLAMVSRGRDSLCMVHVLHKYMDPQNLILLHLQTYPGLRHQEAHIARMSQFFGLPLEVQPSRQNTKIRTGKLPGFSTERDHWRKHYECDLVAYGFRSDESVSRSVIMRQWPDGINRKSNECYPLKRWNRSIVAAYASQIRAPMAEEYQYGFRDCGEQYTGASAIWLHDTHPDDFATACTIDSMLAAEYTRATGLPA